MPTVRQTAWRAATRRVGPKVLSRVLNYYNFSPNDKRNFMNAYVTYLNAVNNRSKREAREAGIKFTNTLFKLYEKQSRLRRRSPVANGFTNGVQASVVYWLPGVLFRRAVYRRGASVPTPRRRSASM